MAKDPAFLFYPGDWLSGTMYLTHEQKGAYMDLLILQFNCGKFTEAQAKQVLSICFDVAWAMLKQKFKKEGEFYFNERLSLEIEKRKNFTQSRRDNASGTKKDKTYNSTQPKTQKHMLEHMEDEDINEDESLKLKKNKIDFELFWIAYDKKVGDKDKIKKKWDLLKLEEQELIIIHIPKYKISQPDKKFRKDPQTYLNNKSWLDEVILTQNFNNNGTGTKNRDANKVDGRDRFDGL